MPLKTVTLHRATADNLDGFHDAGATLTVGEENKPGMIHPDRARDLVASHGGVGHHQPAAAPKKAKAPRRTRAAKPAAEPVPAPVVTPPAETLA